MTGLGSSIGDDRDVPLTPSMGAGSWRAHGTSTGKDRHRLDGRRARSARPRPLRSRPTPGHLISPAASILRGAGEDRTAPAHRRAARPP